GGWIAGDVGAITAGGNLHTPKHPSERRFCGEICEDVAISCDRFGVMTVNIATKRRSGRGRRSPSAGEAARGRGARSRDQPTGATKASQAVSMMLTATSKNGA